MCVGFVSDGKGKYIVREVTQLMSVDHVDASCNTAGDHVFHKSCPGDVSFVQVARDIVNGKISPTSAQMPFQHEITVTPVVGSKGDIVFRQALLYEGRQVGPIYSRTLGQITSPRTVKIDFSIPMPLPGYYTLVSKLTDELGQPLYEWKWSTKYTTADFDTDKKLRAAHPVESVFGQNGWTIQTYDEFVQVFNSLYERPSERAL